MKLEAFCMALTLASVLPACAPVATEPIAGPATLTHQPATPTPHVFMPVPDEMRAETAAREALAQHLGLDMAQIATREITPADWPDSCLGLAPPGQTCHLDKTPGFRIVFEVDDAAYEVRTDMRSETVLVAGRIDN